MLREQPGGRYGRSEQEGGDYLAIEREGMGVGDDGRGLPRVFGSL